MSETFNYENLEGGSQKPKVQVPGTVALGQVWVRGTLVAKLTATQKWQLADIDAYGNYDDIGIAVEAVDTTGGETNTTVFVEGEFNENGVTFPTVYSDDADDWRQTLRDHGIYLRSSVSTAGV